VPALQIVHGWQEVEFFAVVNMPGEQGLHCRSTVGNATRSA
jgi:hypothetical protein